MKYDDLVEYLGELGPYQKRSYFLACLPAITAAIHALTPVFILAVPDSRCAIPGYENDTYKVQSSYHQALINYTLPWTEKDDDDEDAKYGKGTCRIFKDRSALNFGNASSINPNNVTTSCHKWVYDREVFDNSFVTDADLVCGDKVLRSHANMIYMCGLLFGSIFYGFYSDRFGRKTAFVTALIVHAITTIALSFADSFVYFAIIRFILGTSGMGLFMCCFVLGVELLGCQYRAQAGTIIQFFWCFGMFTLNILAYFIRDWRRLQLVVSCYTVIYLVLYWVVPESPRWQMSKGNIKGAQITLEKIAAANKKELPKDAFTQDEKSKDDDDAPQGKLSDIFKSKILIFRVIVVFVNWLVVTMVYYGLTLNVGSLGGNIFLNFSLSGLVETLGNVATLLALPVVGRKRFHCFAMLLGGTACLACMIPAIIDTDVGSWVTVMLSNIGKFGAAAGFTTIYVFTAELFPTFMRNSIVGASSMVARLGGIAAPYIADLGILVGGKFGTVLPYVVFGGCSVVAGLMALTLPETLNKGTPETIEDAISFGRKQPEQVYSDKGLTMKAVNEVPRVRMASQMSGNTVLRYSALKSVSESKGKNYFFNKI